MERRGSDKVAPYSDTEKVRGVVIDILTDVQLQADADRLRMLGLPERIVDVYILAARKENRLPTGFAMRVLCMAAEPFLVKT